MEEKLGRQHSTTISRQVSPASLLDVSAGNCQRALVDSSGLLINEMGTLKRSENGSGERVALCARLIEMAK
jgi:hypothetical protein